MYVFYGAETGDLAEVNTLPATPPAVSTVWANGGGYSYLLTNANQYFEFTTTNAAPTMYFRFVVNIDCGTTENMIIFGAYIFDSVAANCGGVTMGSDFSPQRSRFRVGPSGGSFSTFTPDVVGNLVPTVVQGFYTKGTGTNAVMSITVNGTTVSSSDGTGTGTPLYFRFTGATSTGAVKIYIDDIAISDTAFPSVNGKCLCRQAKAGTPFYNGWTKTGGTTVDLCWADTPVNTTKFCVPTVAGAQTGLISFATTQTGHGTATIGASDTINGIKVIINGKKGSGAARTHAVRFRYNAADNDSADWTAITTSNQFFIYVPPIASPTVALLNASEAGAVQGTGTLASAFTVNDVWVVVDYTPVSGQAMAMIL